MWLSGVLASLLHPVPVRQHDVAIGYAYRTRLKVHSREATPWVHACTLRGPLGVCRLHQSAPLLMHACSGGAGLLWRSSAARPRCWLQGFLGFLGSRVSFQGLGFAAARVQWAAGPGWCGRSSAARPRCWLQGFVGFGYQGFPFRVLGFAAARVQWGRGARLVWALLSCAPALLVVAPVAAILPQFVLEHISIGGLRSRVLGPGFLGFDNACPAQWGRWARLVWALLSCAPALLVVAPVAAILPLFVLEHISNGGGATSPLVRSPLHMAHVHAFIEVGMPE